ncbi:MAG: DUF4358 domain-containing protein [Clostridia bacterium]|nr:DUF4358 domain-containing protein [Clostridia bacterium]
MKDKYIKRNSCRRFNNACALFIMLVFVFNMLSPVVKYSILENRYLQEFPKFTISGFLDGSYMEDVENYLNDHFIGRDSLVKLKAGVEYVTGKQENNGVYVCDDDYLIEKPATYDEKIINNNINAVKTLNDIGRYNVTVAVVPPAFEVMQEHLPEYVYNDTIPKLNKHIEEGFSGTDINVVNTTEDMRKYKDEYLYYRTDHHTTSNGAFIIYNSLSKALGYTALKGEDFKISDVTREFMGTTYSKALKYVSPDIITEYKPLETARFKVRFPYDGKEADSMYFPEHLSGKDKYSYFLDGNHALTVIESPNKNGKSIAILRDSYANCTAPFIANHYEEVHMIDLRYYNDDIIAYLSENNIEEVLFLYSSQTFMTDESISKITSYAKSSPYCMQEFGPVYKTKPVDESYFTDTAFIGDSLTDGFRMHAGLPDATFLCGTSMTISGLSTREWRDGMTMMDRIKQGGFKKVYIMLGINENIVFEYKDTFIENYKQLIDTVRQYNPDAIIYVQSILPVTASMDAKGRITNQVINAFNEGLSNIVVEKQAYYLDINSSLVNENGQLPEEAAVDGVHFKKEYYLKWLDYLKVHTVSEKNAENAKKSPQRVFSNGDYDVSAIADTILDNVAFRDELSAINTRVLLGIYGIDEEKIQNAAGYAGGGATAEEIAVFEVKDINDVMEVEDMVYAHIESRKKSFESYIPEEMPKLKRPYIYIHKKLVIVCIADKYGDVESKIKQYIN